MLGLDRITLPVRASSPSGSNGELYYNSADGKVYQYSGVASAFRPLLTEALASTTYAPLASPTFTGTVTIPTAAITTLSGTPNFSGAATGQTAGVGTNTTQLATTAYVMADFVRLTTAQTVAGVKTFSSVITPTVNNGIEFPGNNATIFRIGNEMGVATGDLIVKRTAGTGNVQYTDGTTNRFTFNMASGDFTSAGLVNTAGLASLGIIAAQASGLSSAVRLQPGTSGAAGFVEWLNSSGTRIGLIGNDNANIYLLQRGDSSFSVDSSAASGLTVEAPIMTVLGGGTKTFGTAPATQRHVRLDAPTYAAAAAATITNAATMTIVAAPIAGTNMTITNAYALWVQGGKSRFGGNVDTTGQYQVNGTQISAANLSNGTTGSGAVVLSAAPTLSGTIGLGSTGTLAWTEFSLFRNQADELRLDGAAARFLISNAGSTTAAVFSTYKNGETTNRFQIAMDGTLSWGPGSSAVDTSLSRVAAGAASLNGAQLGVWAGGSSYAVFGNATALAANSLNYALLQSTSGDTFVNVATGTFGHLRSNNVDIATWAANQLTFTPGGTTGNPTVEQQHFQFNPPAQAFGGSVTTQRALVIGAPGAYSSSVASIITNAATVAIGGAPTAGTNVSINNAYALWIQSGSSRFDNYIQIPGSGTALGMRIGATAAKASQYEYMQFWNATDGQDWSIYRPAATRDLRFYSGGDVMTLTASSVTMVQAFAHSQALTTTFPSSPIDGQIVNMLVDSTNGIVWQFKYRSASASTYKWEFIGGPPLYAVDTTDRSFTLTTTATEPATGLTVTVPLAGDYDVEHGTMMWLSGAQTLSFLSGIAVGSTSALEPTLWSKHTGVDQYQYANGGIRLTAVAASSVIRQRYARSGGVDGGAFVSRRYMRVKPVRCI